MPVARHILTLVLLGLLSVTHAQFQLHDSMDTGERSQAHERSPYNTHMQSHAVHPLLSPP